MKDAVKSVLFALALAFSGLLGFGAYSSYQPEHTDSHSVKVYVGTSHGSATHIGNGYFVTAQHVVDGKAKAILKTDSGRTVVASVLWVNSVYDVALLRADISGIEGADMDCRTPSINEELDLRGNPLILENITTKGFVAGQADTFGDWLHAFPIDGVVGPGMSGGGAFDEDGDLVGIIVGGVMVRFGDSVGPLGVGIVVPASVVCMLMAR